MPDVKFYRERGGSFVLVFPKDRQPNGCVDAVGNVYDDNSPSLASTSASRAYLKRCRRVRWSEVSPDWQEAFRHWLTAEPVDG